MAMRCYRGCRGDEEKGTIAGNKNDNVGTAATMTARRSTMAEQQTKMTIREQRRRQRLNGENDEGRDGGAAMAVVIRRSGGAQASGADGVLGERGRGKGMQTATTTTTATTGTTTIFVTTTANCR